MTDCSPAKGTARFIKCLACGNDFWVSASNERKGKKLCSMACRDSAKRAKIYDDVNQEKRCARCEEWKPFSEFAPSRGGKAAVSGMALQAYCSPCSVIVSDKWAKQNPKKKRAHAEKSYLRHDAETRRLLKKPMTEVQRIKKNESQRDYRVSNPEKIRLINRIHFHKRRAAGKMPSRIDIGRMFCAQDAKCPYCHCPLLKYHIDHKTPVSRGGTNSERNLQLLCPTCNMRKSDRTHEEYITKLAMDAAYA